MPSSSRRRRRLAGAASGRRRSNLPVPAFEGAQEHHEDMWRPRTAALAFDPAVFPHFHVFELVNREEHKIGSAVKAVHIYSSETGTWVRRENEWWGYEIVSSGHHAYANGSLHLTTADAENGLVASVDTAGTTWKVTRVCPEHPAKLGGSGGFIGPSRRRLFFLDAGAGSSYAPELAIYALEPGRGGGAERWILKQRVRNLQHQSGRMWFGTHHAVVGIHPECGVIFLFDSRGRKLVAYDMDQGTARVICTFTGPSRKYHFFPYVPLHS
ncbi:hypothetical protein EJB05_18775 [Eragrostis curvula]|uniref:DUF295 domain-containing protein n=1 Tax=Eragrostis curvula TaxID=38414 RepID=A0A5J9VMX6_9POAL|nr:hypothetical protein EJB05_18775 [Eragrostis curvula]